MTRRLPDPIRTCVTCGCRLARGRTKAGELQPMQAYMQRKHCSTCMEAPKQVAKVGDLAPVLGERGRRCRGVDVNSLYPGDNDRRAVYRLRSVAYALCGRCPVREACDLAGEEGEEWGLWGGKLRHGKDDPTDLLRPAAELPVPHRRALVKGLVAGSWPLEEIVAATGLDLDEVCRLAGILVLAEDTEQAPLGGAA